MERLGRKKTDPDYGRGEHTIRSGDETLFDDEAVTQRLLAAFHAPDYRPPTLPSVATELLALSQNASVDFPDVVALLERDAMLAARVLRIASSPAYAGCVPGGGLLQALRRLGLQSIRDIVLEVVMDLRIFRAEAYGEAMVRVAAHSRATAYLARLLAARTLSEATGELAFLCGLLHDVGIAGTLIVLGETPRGQRRPELGVLWPAIDRAHEEAGMRMAALWDLPATVRGALASHHHPAGEDEALAAVVCVADELAAELGHGLCGDDEEDGGDDLVAFRAVDSSDPAARARARETLRLDEAAVGRLREEARGLLAPEEARKG